jgi:hypothetical protein
MQFNDFCAVKKSLWILLFLFSANHLWAKVWTVDNNFGVKADSTSLQGVINVASVGDTIIVMPSLLNYGTINITKKLFIYSQGFSTYIKTDNLDKLPILSTTTINTNVSGLKLAGLIFSERVYINCDSSELFCNDFRGSVYLGNHHNLLQGNLFSKLTFSVMLDIGNSRFNKIFNNYFCVRTQGANYTNANSMIENGDTTNLVKNNLFVELVDGGGGISGGGFQFFKNSSAKIQNNIIWSNVANRSNFQTGNTASVFQKNITYSVYNKPDTLPGVNYNDTMPSFVGGYSSSFLPFYRFNNQLQLASNSIGKGAGTDSQDIGLYGNSYDFDMLGKPSFIPLINDVKVLNAVEEKNNRINVKIKIINDASPFK